MLQQIKESRYHPQTKLRKGSVFTSVSQEFYQGRCTHPLAGRHPPGQTPPSPAGRHPPMARHPLAGRQPPSRQTPTPGRQTPPGSTPPWQADTPLLQRTVRILLECILVLICVLTTKFVR